MSESVQTKEELQQRAADKIVDVGLAMLAEEQAAGAMTTKQRPRPWAQIAALLAILITVTVGIWPRGSGGTAADKFTLRQLQAALAEAPRVQTPADVAALPKDCVAVRLATPSPELIKSAARIDTLLALAIGGVSDVDAALDVVAADAIAKHTQVRFLEIHEVDQLSLAVVQTINSSPSIKGLHLARAPLPDDLPKGALLGLDYLGIEDRTHTGKRDETTLTDERLVTIVAGAHRLDEFALIDTMAITPAGIACVDGLQDLRRFRFTSVYLTERLTTAIASLNVAEVDLSRSLIASPGVLAPLGDSEHIESLDVSFIPRLTSNDFLGIGKMQSLRTINMSGYRPMTMKKLFGQHFEFPAYKDIARCLRAVGKAERLERILLREIKNVPLATLAKVANERWHIDLTGSTLIVGDGDNPTAPVTMDHEALLTKLGIAELVIAK